MRRRDLLLACLSLCLLCLPALRAWGQDSCVLAAIELEGARRTRPAVVLRELPFAQGGRLPLASLAQALEQARSNLYNLGLFTQVELEPRIEGGLLRLRIVVHERWYLFGSVQLDLEERNSFDFIEALRRRDFSRWVYGGSLSWRNCSGRNENLLLQAQGGFSQRFWLRYDLPALLPREWVDLKLRFAAAREQSLLLGALGGQPRWEGLSSRPLQRRWLAKAGLMKRYSPYRSFYVDAGFAHYRLDDSLPALLERAGLEAYLPGEGLEAAYPSFSAHFVDDRRDWQAFPLTGVRFQLFARVAGPALRGQTAFAKLSAAVSAYRPLGRRWNLAGSLYALHTAGRQIPFFEKTALGISRSEFLGQQDELRGYEPYLLAATDLAMAKAELKFALLRRQVLALEGLPLRAFRRASAGAYLCLFTEHAWLQDRSAVAPDLRFDRQWLGSAGAGLSLLGPYDLLLRLEYSRNRHGRGGIYVHTTLPLK
jgi:outer membrane protein assembly factor BamA